MDKEGIINRIKELQSYYCVSDYTFSEKIGVDRSNLSKIYSGQRTAGNAIINKIVLSTGASKDWIISGEGTMFTDRHDKLISVNCNDIKENDYRGTPIYDIDATCGFEGREIEFTDDKIIGSIDVPEIRANSKIIFATGDSMLPIIASGDRIVIREIENWDYFNYGQIYLILTEEYRLIKRIRKCEGKEDEYIILRSENKEYDDIPLHKSKIKKLFIVENILSIRNIL